MEKATFEVLREQLERVADTREWLFLNVPHSQLDGWFTAATLRQIATLMDQLHTAKEG